MRFTPHRLRSIISAKLGRCPRCMRSSILGTIVGWPVVVLLALLQPSGPYRLVVPLVLAVTLAFTLLMLAHLGVFARRVLLASPGTDALSRRQFLSTAMGVGLAAFTSALFGPSCTRPSPTDDSSASDAGGMTANVEPATDECAVCLDDCVRRFTVCRERQSTARGRAECLSIFQRCQERCRLAGGPCFVASPAPPQRCSPLSGSICDANRANITAARCQTKCNPGTPECMRVAPNDICRGQLQGPVFRRVVGRQELFCQWCACICGTFVPGR